MLTPPNSQPRPQTLRPIRIRDSALLVAALACLALQPAVRAETVAYTGATAHTAAGPAITNATLVVRDGKIVAVGAPSGTPVDRTVSLAGLHVFPGLIAADTSLGLIEIDEVRATIDAAEVGEFNPDVQAWQAVNPDSEIIPTTRANGITHAEVVPRGGPVAGYSGVVQLAGWTTEAMTVRPRAALHVSWPGFQLDLTPRRPRGGDGAKADPGKSLEDQVKERNRRLREIDEFFNDAEAYAKLASASPLDPSFRRAPAWEAVGPVITGAAPVLIHADERRQIESAAAWLARRHYRGAIVGGRDAWRCAAMLASNHVAVVYTSVFAPPPFSSDAYDVQFAAPGLMHKAGVRVVIGDGGAPSFARNLPYFAAQAAAFGLPGDEALKSLTLYPAEILGLGERLGSLAAGKDATFFAATGDILDIRTRVIRLWIAGEEVDLSSRHTRLYDRYRRRPKP